MTAAAADLVQTRDANNPSKIGAKIKNAAQIYKKAYGALDTGTGFIKAWAAAAGEILLGRIDVGDNYGTGLGNTSATFVPEAAIEAEGHIRYGVTVTGASAATDQGKKVYLSDDQTFTLTRPSRGVAAGIVVRWHSSTTCDVMVFGTRELLLQNLAGNAAQLVHLGSFDAPNLATGDVIKATIPSRYRVRSIYAVVAKALAGGTSIVFTFKQNSTAFTTGGVLTLNTSGGTGGTVGDKVSATAITQDSTTVFSESDTLTGSVAVTGTFTADTGGNFNVFAIIDLEPGV